MKIDIPVFDVLMVGDDDVVTVEVRPIDQVRVERAMKRRGLTLKADPQTVAFMWAHAAMLRENLTSVESFDDWLELVRAVDEHSDEPAAGIDVESDADDGFPTLAAESTPPL